MRMKFSTTCPQCKMTKFFSSANYAKIVESTPCIVCNRKNTLRDLNITEISSNGCLTYQRKCPQCSNNIVYLTLDRAIKNSKKDLPCLDCKRINRFKELGVEIIIDQPLNGKYQRKCPTCEELIIHTSRNRALHSVKNNIRCQDCKAAVKFGVVKNDDTWFRVCPKCMKRIKMKTRSTCLQSARQNHICNSCKSISEVEIPTGVEFHKDEGKWGKWYRTCNNCKRAIKCNNGKTSAINGQKKFSHCNVCAPPPNQGKAMLRSVKNKLAAKAKKRWSDPKFRNKMQPHIRTFMADGTRKRRVWSQKVCDLLDAINEDSSIHGMFFRHEKNHKDGEFSCVCYFADGYDENNNIWFEYDEPIHESYRLKKRDVIREKRIQGKLKCRFIRYSEKYRVFYERLPDGTYKKLSSLA